MKRLPLQGTPFYKCNKCGTTYKIDPYGNIVCKCTVEHVRKCCTCGKRIGDLYVKCWSCGGDCK